ncbi:MAG: hypothetical protein MI867_24780, partial [Pseudomonadales bacterium]|nr:hypothetical protein [Pseudomonadales bacterium]
MDYFYSPGNKDGNLVNHIPSGARGKSGKVALQQIYRVGFSESSLPVDPRGTDTVSPILMVVPNGTSAPLGISETTPKFDTVSRFRFMVCFRWIWAGRVSLDRRGQAGDLCV